MGSVVQTLTSSNKERGRQRPLSPTDSQFLELFVRLADRNTSYLMPCSFVQNLQQPYRAPLENVIDAARSIAAALFKADLGKTNA